MNPEVYIDANFTLWFFIFISGVVVQLKTISGALSADEKSSDYTAERTGLLQQILVYVVSIICSFIDLNSNVYEKGQLYSNTIGSVSRDGTSPVDSSGSSKVPSSEIRLRWHQRAVVSVMEAGGLNWLVGKVGKYFFLFFCVLCCVFFSLGVRMRQELFIYNLILHISTW